MQKCLQTMINETCSNLENCHLVEQRLPSSNCEKTKLKLGCPIQEPSDTKTTRDGMGYEGYIIWYFGNQLSAMTLRIFPVYTGRRLVKEARWSMSLCSHTTWHVGNLPSFTAVKPRQRSADTNSTKAACGVVQRVFFFSLLKLISDHEMCIKRQADDFT